MGFSFFQNSKLQMEIKALREKLEAFRNGEVYQKLRKEYETLLSGKDKEISALKLELANVRSQVVNVRENWFSSYDEYVQKTEPELKKKDAEIERKHDYYVYQCNDCGKEFVSQQSPNLWAECQYGSTIKAIAVSAMNTMNAAMNKVPLFLSGMTNGRVEPCEGTRS